MPALLHIGSTALLASLPAGRQVGTMEPASASRYAKIISEIHGSPAMKSQGYKNKPP